MQASARAHGHEIVERALKLSTADDAIVIVTESTTANLRWANNTLTTNGSTLAREVAVISIIGRSFGGRSATNVEGSSLEELVRASENDARRASEAQDYEQLPAGIAQDDFTQPAIHTSPSVFRDFVGELGEALTRSQREGRRLFGFASYDLTTTWLGTTAGTRRRWVQPTGSVDWNAKNDVERGSVWHGQSTLDFTDVSPIATEELLTKRLGWCERSVDLPAGRYETLVPPSALADMAIYMYWMSSGRSAAEGRSVFSKPGGGTRVGEKIAVDGLDMYSDPADPQLGSSPFVVDGSSSSESSVFDNGLDIGRSDWISNGVLGALIETRATARKRDVSHTPYVDNLIIDTGGTATIDEMVATTKRGLLLTCLWYIRDVDSQRLLLTGLTRDGVYLVENGEITGVANNFRYNESPIELLGRISEAGRSVQTLPREWGDYFTLTRMPPVRIPDFNMSTVSPAS